MGSDAVVSVIMGVYRPADQARFFRAVQSVIGQTYPHWELLIYDDGSGEEYAGMFRRAAAMDGRIRLLGEACNRGLAHALNACIRQAAGRYIARMDDDDIAKPVRLERQAAFLEEHPAYQWVGSNAELIDGGGVWGYQKMPDVPQARDFLFNSPYIHPTVMFRRETLAESGGYCESRRVLQCEDYELFMRLHRAGGQGCNLQEALLQYWEDYESLRKRTYRRRIREMQVRRRGFRELGILNRNTCYYVFKPLLVGAVPAPVHHYIRRKLKRPKERRREGTG